MKKTFRKLTASLTAMLMMFSSTYAVASSASAESTEVQPRGWHVYGDVTDDGKITMSDAVLVVQFMTVYKNSHNNSIISVENAIDYKGEFKLPVPQAADIDGDGYITDADAICIQYYDLEDYEKAGRCGQPFFIE